MADIFSFSVSRICQWLPNSRTQRKKNKGLAILSVGNRLNTNGWWCFLFCVFDWCLLNCQFSIQTNQSKDAKRKYPMDWAVFLSRVNYIQKPRDRRTQTAQYRNHNWKGVQRPSLLEEEILSLGQISREVLMDAWSLWNISYLVGLFIIFIPTVDGDQRGLIAGKGKVGKLTDH